MTKQIKKSFLFPIETSAREFDQRIFMGILCAKNDREIFIGEQQIIRLLSFFLKNGVFYGKHLFGKPSFSDQAYYKRLKKNNFNLVYISEEGAVFPGKEDTWSFLLDQASRPSVLNDNEYFLTWGEWQLNHYLKSEKIKAKTAITGHPRFDLYQKKYHSYFKSEVDSIKKEHGEYILFNTAFSFSNHSEGESTVFKATKSYNTANKAHRKYRFDKYSVQLKALADTASLINDLSLEFPGLKIILRPHPSEDTSLYNNIFRGVGNVEVIYGGSVTPWILGCRALFHSGCTTAIEAMLADKPVISYSYNNDNYIYLAEKSSLILRNTEEIINYVKDRFPKKNTVIHDDLTKSLFHNFKVKDTTKLVHNVIEKSADSVLINKNTNRFYLRLITPIFYIYLTLKYIYLYFKGRSATYKDFKKRFEVFDKIFILKKVNEASDILGKNVEVKYYNKYLFSIKISNKDGN